MLFESHHLPMYISQSKVCFMMRNGPKRFTVQLNTNMASNLVFPMKMFVLFKVFPVIHLSESLPNFSVEIKFNVQGQTQVGSAPLHRTGCTLFLFNMGNSSHLDFGGEGYLNGSSTFCRITNPQRKVYRQFM